MMDHSYLQRLVEGLALMVAIGGVFQFLGDFLDSTPKAPPPPPPPPEEPDYNALCRKNIYGKEWFKL